MDTLLSPLLILFLLFIGKLDVCAGDLQQEDRVIVCKEGERKALLDLKQGFHDPSGILSSWTGNNCCISWKGVQCSTRNGHVVLLDLGGKGPLYDLNADLIHSEELGGEIRRSLLSLRHLRYLNLSNNNFEEIQIPSFIGSLHSLRYLDLSSAGFTGIVPYQLGNLTNLHYLDLSENGLLAVGNHWLSNLSSLQYLNLRTVDLSEAPDILYSLNALQWISEIKLSDCNLNLPLSFLHANFTSLHLLDLSGNNLNSTVPLWLFELRSLQYLYLGVNQFSNLIPPVVSNLTNLKVLDLSYSYEVKVPKSLGNLCMLRILDLSGNNLSIELRELGGIFSGCIIHNLEALWLSSAGLVGNLPRWLGNLKSLKTLVLFDNSLYGPIPELHLPSLQELDLSYNTLNETLPKNLGQLFPELVILKLQKNNLVGVLTETHFANVANIEHLDLSSNKFIFNTSSNWIPPSRLEDIILDGCQIGPRFPAWVQKLENLFSISMPNAGISDVIPDWFWNFNLQLQYVDLSDNDIKGKLPYSLEHLDLQIVYLSDNNLEGSIPHFSPAIDILSLRNNSFSGIIHDRWNRSLQSSYIKVDLSYNNLSGTFPTSICANTSLRILHLNENNLSGELPLQLTNCKYLSVLDLGSNMFSGGISSSIWDGLLYLQVLRLRSNLFSGSIPPQLGGFYFLRVIDLAHNQFSGEIPINFGNLESMKNASIFSLYFNYDDEIEVEMKGRELAYGIANSALPVTIDLSGNDLSGEIPKKLTNLRSLRTLHLSENHLTGKIPEDISELHQLESLDLSVNNLSGVIPESMTMLTSLSELNLSFNQLSGKIPSGGQFQTFIDDSIYSNNYNLCGFPLDVKCNEDGTSQSPIFRTSEKDFVEDDERRWFYTSMGLGFAFGLLAFCSALIINKRWCFIYFQLLDNMSNWIYVAIVVKFNKIKRTHFFKKNISFLKQREF